MGKYSSLGPIDPQIGGIPVHGVVEEFNRAVEEIKIDPDKILIWQPIISKYHPAFIGRCEKALEMVEDMVIDWLSKGMFEDDDEEIETVDEEGNEILITKSTYIAKTLINAKIFKSHDRHIDPEACIEMGLKIRLLEDEPDLQDAVLSVHHACLHTLSRARVTKIIENYTGKTFLQMAPS